MLTATLLVGALTPNVGAQPHGAVSTVQAVRVATAPRIDGHLDDEAWQAVTPATEFTQRDPDEGQPATERTEMRVVYDDAALYVGVRLHDREAGRIVRRLSRRDDFPDADRFTVYFDPHHDHLTGAMFTVSAAGSQADAIVYNDTWEDNSWDAVWDAAVSTDTEGWTVEMRIPFSQLRFPRAERDAWGINAARFIQRRNESDWLQLVPKKENGLASRMAHLTGVQGLRPPRQFEVVPYTVGRAEFIEPDAPGDPFNDGSRLFAGLGADLKYGLSSNFTLNAAINPDFGQVEVDPAVVNLTAFETFYSEKRPFFIEGSQIFGNFGQSGSNSFWGFNSAVPTIFYSRRIGRAPQGRRRRVLHRSADRDDDPRRRQGDRQDVERVDGRAAERRHREGVRPPRGRRPGPRGDRAAHQLLRRPSPARDEAHRIRAADDLGPARLEGPGP